MKGLGSIPNSDRENKRRSLECFRGQLQDVAWEPMVDCVLWRVTWGLSLMVRGCVAGSLVKGLQDFLWSCSSAANATAFLFQMKDKIFGRITVIVPIPKRLSVRGELSEFVCLFSVLPSGPTAHADILLHRSHAPGTWRAF